MTNDNRFFIAHLALAMCRAFDPSIASGLRITGRERREVLEFPDSRALAVEYKE